MSDLFSFISRLYYKAQSHNVLNVRTVEIFFQKSPGWDQGDKRGIEGLKHQVVVNGKTVKDGTTESDGKVDIQIRGGKKTILKIADTEYDIKIKYEGYEDKGTVKGIQQRLRTLGYQLGADIEVNFGKIGKQTDRAILQFQADHNMIMLGENNSDFQKRLNKETT